MCNCGWSGICVFDDYTRNGQTAKPGRAEVLGTVIERRDISDTGTCKAFLSRLCVPPFLARWCLFPGSFVMLRPEGTREAYNVPVSIMEASTDGVLEVAVEVQGPKTIALEYALRQNNKITVTGPFWSGLQGLSDLARLGTGNSLIVAKGMGQAAVPQIAKYILHRGGSLMALIGPGTLGHVFICDNLQRLGAAFHVLPRSKDHNIGRLKQEAETGKYGLIISSGSPLQHQGILSMLAGLPEGQAIPNFSWTSHLTMTCAEGICGSCLVSGFRGCKAKFDRSFEAYLSSKTV